MRVRRALGAVVIHIFNAIIWGMERSIDEDLWEEETTRAYRTATAAAATGT